jgi:galactokinase
MTGGGFGGCCVALVGNPDAARVEQVIAETYRQKTNLEPNIFATRPADGPAVLLQP